MQLFFYRKYLVDQSRQDISKTLLLSKSGFVLAFVLVTRGLTLKMSKDERILCDLSVAVIKKFFFFIKCYVFFSLVLQISMLQFTKLLLQITNKNQTIQMN